MPKELRKRKEEELSSKKPEPQENEKNQKKNQHENPPQDVENERRDKKENQYPLTLLTNPPPLDTPQKEHVCHICNYSSFWNSSDRSDD